MNVDHLPGDLAVHGVHEMRDHRRRCSAELASAVTASKPDRIALGMSPREPRDGTVRRRTREMPVGARA
jgi:hypothetical protein